MSLIKAVGLHVFVAMYTNHLLTNARPLGSEHLTVLYRLEITLFTLLCCSTSIAHRAPLLDLLTYEPTSQRVATLHQNWQICCCVCCIYVYPPFSVGGDKTPIVQSYRFLYGCVPAYDDSVQNRGRSFARMTSSSRWSSYRAGYT